MATGFQAVNLVDPFEGRVCEVCANQASIATADVIPDGFVVGDDGIRWMKWRQGGNHWYCPLHDPAETRLNA